MAYSVKIIEQYFSDLTPQQQQQFGLLEPLYQDWNNKINVISRKDIEGLYLKHVLHSLSIAAIFDFKPGMQVVDIGAGGGFPSVPLAILFPEVKFHAVDSIRKKLTVIEAVATGASISNITVQHSRAEDIRDRRFDVAVSRAVAPLKDLIAWTQKLLRKPNEVKKQFQSPGSDERIACGLICLKGGDLGPEISASGRKPYAWQIAQMFKEDFFQEKYVLQVV